ncbi:MAG TPA: bifunctional riboflavin kinase/FAD synthetase [Pirellulales bacterium]|nr:bifunctional riboflavin kinase/FAD synthetase [Pirellulales bacterium]
MNLLRDWKSLPSAARGGAVSIGNFDGVHQGHARLVAQLTAQARRLGGPAVVFTFEPHPVRLLRPDSAPPPLTWIDRKAELLGELGVDWVFAYPTDQALLNKSARAFFEEIVCGRLQAQALVEGPNFFFGHDRLGTVDVLRQFCAEAQLHLEIMQPLRLDGELVSSSRIRQLIQLGAMAEAARLLTQPYRIRGMVTHGAGRGATIGFPTANLAAVDTLIPAAGVYAGLAYVAGERYAAAINIGPNPTFGDPQQKIEVHLLDLQRSLYGQPLEVDFSARLRDIQAFAGVEALQTQLAQDVLAARQLAVPRLA